MEAPTNLFQAAYQGDGDTAERLISQGDDVNAKNNNGETPLDVAVRNDPQDVAGLLRKSGGGQ